MRRLSRQEMYLPRGKISRLHEHDNQYEQHQNIREVCRSFLRHQRVAVRGFYREQEGTPHYYRLIHIFLSSQRGRILDSQSA